MVNDRTKYHVMFEDPASGETLGLILDERSGAVGRVARLANPYAAKIGGGDTTLADLTDMSAYGQTDWRAGRGQDRFDEEDRFYDNDRAETRIKDQVTLAPYVGYIGVGSPTAMSYRPTSIEGQAVGKGGETFQTWAQRWATPTTPPSTCTHVWLRLRKTAGGQSRTFTVAMYSDNSAVPGTELASKTLELDDLETVYQDIKFTWDTPVALTGNTYYWFVIFKPSSGPASDTHYIEWAKDIGQGGSGYTLGNPAAWNEGTEAWQGQSGFDFWFSANDDPPALKADIMVNPVRWGTDWFFAAGDTVYLYNSSGGGWWGVSDTVTDETVTDMCVAGGFLYAARGTGNLRRYNGSWADAPGPVSAQLLMVYSGYLYRTDPTNHNTFYYSADGSTWQTVTVGTGETITAMAGFRDEVAIATTRGLWLQAADWTYQVLDWSSQEADSNGVGMYAWARTNELFIPVSHGLYRWTGATMVACGPDMDAGLPSDRAGNIVSLCGTANWLYAVVDAGDDGYSSILVYQGRDWHELYRSGTLGTRIRVIGYETLSSPSRLWFGEAAQTFYMELPDYSDNPYQYEGVHFHPDGELILSSWGSELMPVLKDWRYVIIQVEGCNANQYIEVYYEIDRSGLFTPLGTIDTVHTLHKIAFPTSSFAAKTTGSSCTTTTINVSSGDTTDMNGGDWVRIGGEIRQVKSITDSDTFVLALPLSSTPSSGVTVYAASPLGSEIRLRFRLVTEDWLYTPKLLAVSCFCQANVLDRWQITLDVLVEDRLICLDGSVYPMDAAALQVALQQWIARQTSFTLHDLRGVQRTVKVANAVESTPRRSTSAPYTYGSVMHIGLIEPEVGGV